VTINANQTIEDATRSTLDAIEEALSAKLAH
jgi:hypothetical protein